MAERDRELIHLDLRKITDIDLIARRLSRKAIDDVMLKVHRQSRDWLQQNAVKNLNESIAAHGRPQYANRKLGDRMSSQPILGLRKTINLNKSHVVTSRSVDFMVDDLVRKNAPQYYILEEGYSGFIGKEAPIGFRSGGKNRRANQGRYPNDAALRGQGKVTITRGIKGYHYVAKTVDQFLDQEIFEDLVEKATLQLRLENPGLRIDVKRGPKAKARSFK